MQPYYEPLDRDRNCECASHVGPPLMLKGTLCASMPVNTHRCWRYVCFACVRFDEIEQENFANIQPYKNQTWTESIAKGRPAMTPVGASSP
jgi:hypothetical protein